MNDAQVKVGKVLLQKSLHKAVRDCSKNCAKKRNQYSWVGECLPAGGERRIGIVGVETLVQCWTLHQIFLFLERVKRGIERSLSKEGRKTKQGEDADGETEKSAGNKWEGEATSLKENTSQHWTEDLSEAKRCLFKRTLYTAFQLLEYQMY